MGNLNRKEAHLSIDGKPQPEIPNENTLRTSFFEETASIRMYKPMIT
jgi:hypothetical protein